MDEKIKQEFAGLPQESKDFLMGDELKASCKDVYVKANGPLSRDTVAKIRESFTAFVMPKVSEDVRGKLSGLTSEQKDAVWARISEGNETIELPAYIKLTIGIYTHALAQGVDLENLKSYSNEWRSSFSL